MLDGSDFYWVPCRFDIESPCTNCQENHEIMTDQDKFAEIIGANLGELMDAFLKVISVLRNQPSFDNELFESDIRNLLTREDLSEYSKLALSTLIGESDSNIEIDLNNPNEFTLENVRQLIRAGDDNRNSQIRVRNDGIAYLSYVVGNQQLEGIQFRLETFQAGNEYVGIQASEDEHWIEKVFHTLEQNWSSKTSGYVDFY